MLLAIYKASERATYKQMSKGNATPITQNVIGAAWRLPNENPRTGEAMRRELLMNDFVSCLFMVHIYSL
jgi:hypothetical protein